MRKYPDHWNSLQEKGFISVYSSEGIEFTMAEKTWLLVAGTRNCVIALHLHSGRRGKGGDGKWCQNVTSENLTPVPPEGSMTSPDSTTIWRPRVQTHDLWGTIHTQATTALERQLIGEAGWGKKEPPLEPALRASALRDRRGVTGTLDKQRSKQNPRTSRDLGKCVYGHSTVTVVLVLNWCKLSN